MIGRLLKKYMPRSLYWRAVLIVVVPVGTILIVVSVVFIQRLYEDVTRQMTTVLANEVQLVLDRIDASPDQAEALSSALEVSRPLGISVQAGSGSPGDRRGAFDLSGRVVIDTLHRVLPSVQAVDLVDEDKSVRIAVTTRHGPMNLKVSRSRVTARNPHQFLVVIGVTAALMTVIALLYLRNQIRPIRRLAAAAAAFGKGRSVPYRPAGATEVRAAGGAFLEMRNRIERQIEQRTMMLSGVSHDLRTPLTRMKLALSMMEDDADTIAMRRDVSDMETMLNAFLNFARNEALDDLDRIDPAEIVRSAIERAVRAGLTVSESEIEGNSTSMLRPDALGRALDNLIGNAVRYGTRAIVGVALTRQSIIFSVEDDGPGIPEAKRELALKPFSRLDQARNQDVGSGVGLGLAIASDIARQHGGTLTLADSEALGGLRVVIVLPR